MTQKRNRRAGVEDRWLKADKKTHTANYGKGNRWRARYVDDDGQERAKSFRVKVDAQTWLNEVTANIVTGTYVDPNSTMTFGGYWESWSSRRTWATSGTERAFKLAATGTTFYDTPLAQLRKSDIDSWIKALVALKLQPSTIKTRFRNVKTIMRAAVSDRLLQRDPTIGVQLPRITKPEHAMHIPTAQQVADMHDATAEEDAVIIAIAAFAGLRAGEIAGLQVADIDFMSRSPEIRVRRQAQMEQGEIRIREPKYGSTRDIPAPAGLVKTIAEYIRTCDRDTTHWLFPNRYDATNPITSGAVTKKFTAAIADAGVKDLVGHDLRHFFASGLIASGVDVVAVSKAMGHSSAAFTLNTYAHLWPKSDDKIRAAAAGLITSVNSPADTLRTL